MCHFKYSLARSAVKWWSFETNWPQFVTKLKLKEEGALQINFSNRLEQFALKYLSEPFNGFLQHPIKKTYLKSTIEVFLPAILIKFVTLYTKGAFYQKSGLYQSNKVRTERQMLLKWFVCTWHQLQQIWSKQDQAKLMRKNVYSAKSFFWYIPNSST